VLCSVPSIMGIPVVATNQCEHVIGIMNELMEAIGHVSEALALINPAYDLKQIIKEELKITALEILRDYDKTTADTIDLWRADASIEAMKEVYQRQGNNPFKGDPKNLVVIEDIVTRANKDMGIPVNDGTKKSPFDPDKFAAINNSVLLVKLSLLDPKELNQIPVDAGASSYTPEYKYYLYGADWEDDFVNDVTDNILNAIRSIDGNHQWMPFAPPFPRAGYFVWPKPVGEDNREEWIKDIYKEDTGGFGYVYNRENAPQGGFRYWTNTNLRNKVFRRIFVGPVNPNMKGILPPEYPYEESDANPFPDLKKSVFHGDFTIRNLDDIQMLAGYNEIEGKLTVIGTYCLH